MKTCHFIQKTSSQNVHIHCNDKSKMLRINTFCVCSGYIRCSFSMVEFVSFRRERKASAQVQIMSRSSFSPMFYSISSILSLQKHLLITLNYVIFGNEKDYTMIYVYIEVKYQWQGWIDSWIDRWMQWCMNERICK